MFHYETSNHKHTHLRSDFIDYWNNNKAFIIDSLVLSVHGIQSQVIKGITAFLEVPSRKQNKTHQ